MTHIFENLDQFSDFLKLHGSRIDNTGFRNIVAYLRASREGCCCRDSNYEVAENLYSNIHQLIIERDIVLLKKFTKADQVIFKHKGNIIFTI